MNQVMVEEMSQDWLECGLRITETYVEQPLSLQEESEHMSYLSHYAVQGNQHILVYQIVPMNAKARDMSNIMQRPPIQCYKYNGPHKGNESPQKA